MRTSDREGNEAQGVTNTADDDPRNGSSGYAQFAHNQKGKCEPDDANDA